MNKNCFRRYSCKEENKEKSRCPLRQGGLSVLEFYRIQFTCHEADERKPVGSPPGPSLGIDLLEDQPEC